MNDALILLIVATLTVLTGSVIAVIVGLRQDRAIALKRISELEVEIDEILVELEQLKTKRTYKSKKEVEPKEIIITS